MTNYFKLVMGFPRGARLIAAFILVIFSLAGLTASADFHMTPIGGATVGLVLGVGVEILILWVSESGK